MLLFVSKTKKESLKVQFFTEMGWLWKIMIVYLFFDLIFLLQHVVYCICLIVIIIGRIIYHSPISYCKVEPRSQILSYENQKIKRKDVFFRSVG